MKSARDMGSDSPSRSSKEVICTMNYTYLWFLVSLVLGALLIVVSFELRRMRKMEHLYSYPTPEGRGSIRCSFVMHPRLTVTERWLHARPMRNDVFRAYDGTDYYAHEVVVNSNGSFTVLLKPQKK